MTFDELVNVALLGTSRGGLLPAAGEGAIGVAIASLPAGDAEAQLLGAAALLAAYDCCGHVPAPAAPAIAAASADAKPACSRRAGELLDRVLAFNNTPAKEQLLGEWLTLAIRAGVRPPHASLPTLLEYGAAYRALRAQIAEVIDARGHWLIAQNPRWQFTADAREDAAQIWATGSRDQRESAVRRLRATAPGEARELIRSTWAEDGADERAAFVGTLAVAISDGDEPFLEAALDDRSKQVRAAAISLLARLPASRFTQRMIDRAAVMLTFTPATPGGILKKSRPAAIAVTLPAAFDPDWARDGLVEKPIEKIGQKQSWVRQILSHVPPVYWSTTWKVTPEALLAAAPEDFGDLLDHAWTQAALHHPDEAWATALLRAAARQSRVAVRIELLEGMPPAAGQALVTELLETLALDLHVTTQLVNGGRLAFDAPAVEAILSQLDRLAGGTYDYRIGSLIEGLGLRAAPATYDVVTERWSTPKWEPHRRSIEKGLETLGLRRDIAKELTP